MKHEVCNPLLKGGLRYTMRWNLLNWSNLVSIGKKIRFYLSRIYYHLVDLLQKKNIMKNAKLKFSEYKQNISRSKIFGKFVLIL